MADSIRNRKGSFGIAAVLLVVAALGVLAAYAVHILRSARTSGRDPVTTIWKRPVDSPVSLAVSTDGRFYGCVDRTGLVRLFGADGRCIWSKRVEGATDVLIAHHGQSLLIYSRLNPLYQKVFFYTSTGRLLWRHSVDGCVWAGAVSPNGESAVVTTGEGFVYMYTPDPKDPRFRRWRLNGIGHTAAFTPDGSGIIVGTWQRSGLSAYDLRGELRWAVKHDSERQYRLHMSADGRSILGLLPGTQHNPSIDIRVWDASGRVRWQRKIDGFDAMASISPKGDRVAISYASFASSRRSDVIERKVAVYGSKGVRLWEKGGLFFGPKLVTLAPRGSSVVVTDGENSLYTISSSGQILSKSMLGGKVDRLLSTEDGQKILLYCSDGNLCLIGTEKG